MATEAATPRVYGQLARMRLFTIWLGPVLAGSLAVGEDHSPARSVVLSALFLLVVAISTAAAHAFGDIKGFEDGSDIREYALERRGSQVNPLVQGTLTVFQARRFGQVCVVLALLTLGTSALVAGFSPWWVFAVGTAVIALGVPYSPGIMVSRRFTGCGELLTGLVLTATVALPYAAITGRVTTAAIVESVLFGLWLVQVLICSNSADVEDDRVAGRPTMAAALSPRANRIFIAGVFLLNWTIAISAIATDVVSMWAGMLLQPLWMVEGYVLYRTLRGTWRPRRDYGLIAVRLGVAGLAISNVLGPTGH